MSQLLENLKDLFPSIDIEVIESVIDQVDNDEEAAIELLVQINEDDEDLDEINNVPNNTFNDKTNDDINNDDDLLEQETFDDHEFSNQVSSSSTKNKPSSSTTTTTSTSKSSSSKKLYQILDEEGILNEINNTMNQVLNILQINNNNSNFKLEMILKNYKWNVENIIRDYGDIGLDGILKKIGLLNNLNTTINSNNNNNNNITTTTITTICESCYEDNIELIKNINCEHSLCESCWRNYIESSILQNNGTSIESIKCPSYECNCLLLDEFILSFITSKYEHFLLKSKINSFMTNSHRMKWCSNNCKFAIKKECDENLYYCKCKCDREFCFHCDQDPHYPATCEMMKRFISFTKEHESNLEYIKSTCQQCPSCKVYVHRISGCDSMKNNNTNMEQDLTLLKTFGYLFDMNYERLEKFVDQLLSILRNFTQTPQEELEEQEELEKLNSTNNGNIKNYSNMFEFGNSLFTQEKHLKFHNLNSQIKNQMELIVKQTENIIDMIKSMEMKTI
ncbi:predicted protein [Naegleria gruberi]|uniref:RBR-type E3 ubiquitin transferase n=1 Tax=Naegleria gruberi TaxID=5762 RepID=D2V6R3_NAEGR|nr:uncharacterized protein NAEGRDRAFT_64532 [Naegleria gruberi]EFC47485.1 predicted protein [Naegleria gruberi]|eukprot:XP_002680229.1 predicted protein [Naegleria gruberi strain NEG-M]